MSSKSGLMEKKAIIEREARRGTKVYLIARWVNLRKSQVLKWLQANNIPYNKEVGWAEGQSH